MNIFWCVVFIVFLVIELLTVNLVTLWFAAGALGAWISTAFTGNWMIQTGVFVLVSLVALLALRPLAKKLRKTDPEPTNADRAVGKEAVVTRPVQNDRGEGEVTLEGVVWSAVSEGGEPLTEGERVRVTGIRGVKLVCEPIHGETGEEPAEKSE